MMTSVLNQYNQTRMPKRLAVTWSRTRSDKMNNTTLAFHQRFTALHRCTQACPLNENMHESLLQPERLPLVLGNKDNPPEHGAIMRDVFKRPSRGFKGGEQHKIRHVTRRRRRFLLLVLCSIGAVKRFGSRVLQFKSG